MAVAARPPRRTEIVGRALGTFPFTIFITVAVTAIGVFSGTVLRGRHDAITSAIGTDLGTLVHLRLYTLAVEAFYQDSPGIGWSMVLMVALFVGLLEYAAGTWRAAATFFVSDVAGSVGGIVVLALLGRAGWDYAYHAARTPDTGSSVGFLAAAGAAAALLPWPLRAPSLMALYGFLVLSILRFDFSVWIEHLIGSTVAVALSLWVWSRGPVRLPFPGLVDRLQRGLSQFVNKSDATACDD